MTRLWQIASNAVTEWRVESRGVTNKDIAFLPNSPPPTPQPPTPETGSQIRKHVMPAKYLPDGYTREKQIQAADGDRSLHIAWRPMLAAERRRLNLQTVRLSSRG